MVVSPSLQGILVVDKPQGPTSFEVVRQVRAQLKVKKAGHTGTLDPLATGVLPVCLGEATKLAGFITEGDKAYDAVIRLGEQTDTLDCQGKVVAQGEVPRLTRDRLEQALGAFRGSFQQVPPMYSAIKVGGRRLYELARRGEEIPRAARPVVVHSLELLDFSATELTVSLRCSKGFFVRSLADDLGKALGCGGHLKALRRTRSGPFHLGQAVPLSQLPDLAGTPEGLRRLGERLIPLAEALSELPALTVSEGDAQKVLHGLPLEAHEPSPGGRLRVMGPQGRLLALAQVVSGRLKYLRVFPESSSP